MNPLSATAHEQTAHSRAPARTVAAVADDQLSLQEAAILLSALAAVLTVAFMPFVL